MASAAQAGVLVVLARTSSVAEFGGVNSLISLSMFVTYALDLGLTGLILRERARSRESALVSKGIVVGARLSFLIVLVVCCIGYAGLAGRVDILTLVCLGLWAGVERYAELWTAILIADRREVSVGVSLAARRIVPLIGLAIAVWLGGNSVESFAVWSLVGSVAGAVVVKLRTSVSEPRWQGVSFLSLLRGCLPFWISSGTSQARELEPYLVSQVGNLDLAGQYGFATRIARPGAVVAAAVAQVLLPLSVGAQVSVVRRRLWSLLLFGLGVSGLGLVASPWTDEGVTWLIGDAYATAAPLVSIVLVGMGIVSVAPPLGSIAQAVGSEGKVASVSFWTMVAGLAGFFVGWAVDLTGITSLSLSTVAAGGRSFGFFWVGLRATKIQ